VDDATAALLRQLARVEAQTRVAAPGPLTRFGGRPAALAAVVGTVVVILLMLVMTVIGLLLRP
jgi:hypothetical protein